MEWIKNSGAKTPFFPTPDDAYPAVINAIVRKTNVKGEGLLVTIKSGPYMSVLRNTYFPSSRFSIYSKTDKLYPQGRLNLLDF